MTVISRTLIVVLAVFSGSLYIALAQSRTDKTEVFMTFERAGKLKPLFPDESSNRIWLRLHNNTHRTIIFPVFEVPKEYGDIGMFHRVLIDQDPFIDRKDSDGNWVLSTRPISIKRLPEGYKEREDATTFNLIAGGTIIFSVPREHLAKYLAVGISYNFEGEEDRETSEGKMRNHYIQLSYSELPKEVVKK
jgi:hypothetical protein